MTTGPSDDTPPVHEQLVKVLNLIDDLNGAMSELPRRYQLWMDWTVKPHGKLQLTEGYRIERVIVE